MMGVEAIPLSFLTHPPLGQPHSEAAFTYSEQTQPPPPPLNVPSPQTGMGAKPCHRRG